MSIRKAAPADLETIKRISAETISGVYPHYYPKGAVEFFLEHHNESRIAEDIARGRVFLCDDGERHTVGTVTIKDNEICRLFVLPEYRGKGFGREMMDFAEKKIFGEYGGIRLDASLPAKAIYLKRGYVIEASETISAKYGDFLCYDIMTKSKTDTDRSARAGR